MSFAGSISGGGNTAHGAIVIDTQSLRDAARAARQAATQIEGALNQTGQSAQRAEAGFTGMGMAARVAGGLIATYLTRQTAAAAVEMARTSAVAAGMQQEFRNLTGATQEAADGMLEAMRRASWGLINDFELIAAANRAFLFGVAENTDDMVQLLEIATARAAGMGISTEEALQRLVHGLGTLQPEVLRNLGFAINLNDVYEQYAQTTGKVVSELTQAEKRQAALNVIYAESAEQIERMNEAGGTNAGTLERAKTAADNAKMAFGALIEDDVVRIAREYAEVLEWITRNLERQAALRDERAESGSQPFFTNPFAGAQQWVEFASQPAISPDDLLGGNIARARDSVQDLQGDLAQAEDRLQDFLNAGNLTGAAGARAEIERITEEIRTLSAEIAAADSRIGTRGPPLASVSGAVTRATGGGGAAPSGIDQDALLSAQVDFHRSMQQIERQAHQARLSATEQFESQRSQTIANFQRSMAREAEDHARRRERQEQQHADAIAQIREDGAAREAEMAQSLQETVADIRAQSAQRVADWQADHERRVGELREQAAARAAERQEDHERKVADMREQGAARIAQIESDYRRSREQAERRHRDTLIGAASRLDARAVAMEMRRFDREAQEAEEAQNERLAQERSGLRERIEQEQEGHALRMEREAANLQERIEQEQQSHARRLQREARSLDQRIAQEQAAHDKRLADAKAADEKRIADMEQAFEDQKEQEDEEREIRLRRQWEDHNLQLGQMARAHGERMAQIDRQEADRLRAEEEAFEDRLGELGLFNEDWLRKQQEWKDDALELFDEMKGDWFETLEEMQAAISALYAPRTRPEDFPSLLDPESFPGGNNPAFSTSPNSGDRSVVVQAGAITIQATPGMSVAELRDEFEDFMIDLLEEAG